MSRALSLEKAKISVPLLVAALFYDLSTEKTVSIPSQSERRERDLQELFRKAKPLAAPAATELSALNHHRPDFDAYAAIGAPLAILVGSLNEGCEPYGTAADRFFDALPHARRITLHGQGHLAHLEAAAQLAKAVSAMLNT